MTPEETRQKLTIVPVSLAEACHFIGQYHRHHKPPVGHKFSVGAADETGSIRGVATCGRPVSRILDNGMTLEVNRVATDGCPNACSALYGACRRACFALGYTKLITYTLPTEGGASLRGSGFRCLGEAGGVSWNNPAGGRPRVDTHPTQTKLRWEIEA